MSGAEPQGAINTLRSLITPLEEASGMTLQSLSYHSSATAESNKDREIEMAVMAALVFTEVIFE